MNENKMAFIICYNNELYVKECMDYISWLKIPEGIEIEVIGIVEAESMAAGYNAAMYDSDAKYKVYLHQDVFILNENFIQDVINIFKQNPEYGMLGVHGSNTIAGDGNYWLGWNTGVVAADDSMRQGFIEKFNPEILQEVVAIDGMIMITQYDVTWREDIFDGFDFYDISQSVEFQKAGYKVGIPHQETPWCNHVCGHSKLEKYDIYRQRFCEIYSEFGYCYKANDEIEQQSIKNKEIQKVLPLIEEALEKGELNRMTALLNTSMQFFPYNTQLCKLYVINKIIRTEIQNDICNDFCVNGMMASELLEKYAVYSFLLKRLEFNKPVGVWNQILDIIAESNTLGLESEKVIAEYVVMNDEKVIWKLKRRLEECSNKKFCVQFHDKGFVVPQEKDYPMVRETCTNISIIVNELERKNDNVDYEKMQWMAELVFNTMVDVYHITHIGHMEEAFYMSYLDVIEKNENMSVFIEQCRKWLNKVLDYVNRKDQEPLVSVLTSVYNGEKFVEDTLKSVMNQSYKNLQIIVVDDCSSDNSREIIERLALNDTRIIPLYMKENSNVCKACNAGYKIATGKYIALIGHDDIWKEDKIEKQVHFMEMQQEYAACFTLVDIIDDENEICNDKASILYQIFEQRNSSQKEWIQTLLFKENIFCAPSVLIRRECVTGDNIYHYGIVQLQDMALWLELLKDYPVYILQERLTLYRKFFKSDSNLSAFNETTRNRLKHEWRYVVTNYIQALPDEKFRFYLQEFFRDKNARTEAELRCERAFIMLEKNDLHCIELFMELFDNEETREVLENKYNFKLNDFYSVNSKTYAYDDEASYQLMNAREMLSKCERIIELQQKTIEKQQQILVDNGLIN